LADWTRWSLIPLALAGCADGSDALAGIEQPIIYGSDDRLDVYEHPDAVLQGVARSSAVALVPRSRIQRSKEGDFFIFTQPLEEAFHVCADERFAAQPTAAECSGVLIDDDLVLTAGHCFPSDDVCSRYAIMFDYFLRDSARLEPLSWGDIYGCRRIVKRVVSPDPSAVPRIDYAIIQLDRSATGRKPVTVRKGPLLPGEPLSTIGCASGLPMKIDSGAHVLATRGDALDYFLLDSDTFQGSSGSGVFDVNGALVGVLVRGGEDYTDRSDATCKVPKVVSWPLDASPPRAVGEEATYVQRALDGLCSDARWPSQQLCNVAARCGDAICNEQETQLDCPADCACRDCSPAQQRAQPGKLAKSRDDDEGCALASSGASGLWWAVLALLARRKRSQRPAGSSR
jgi:hypothetical protein